jgi:hypothetical protein
MKGPAEFISWAPLKIVQLEHQLGPGRCTEEDQEDQDSMGRGMSWHVVACQTLVEFDDGNLE